jgi:hypothetical protein
MAVLIFAANIAAASAAQQGTNCCSICSAPMQERLQCLQNDIARVIFVPTFSLVSFTDNPILDSRLATSTPVRGAEAAKDSHAQKQQQ